MKLLDNNLTISNYKEPLRPVKDGFGYQGTLIGTIDGTKIQCHICGELFGELSKHIIRHKMNVKEYREKFELARSTALISESVREERKVRTLKWLNSLSPEEKKDFLKRSRSKMSATAKKKRALAGQPKVSLETKNKRGTCPDQLLDKIKKCAEAIGQTPSKREFIDWCESQRYVHLIYKTFGSWSAAIKMINLKKRVKKECGGRKKYSNEELLEYLQIFYQENGTPPTETDCRRGLIPDSSVYKRRFGSLPKARELAGIYDEVSKGGYFAKYGL